MSQTPAATPVRRRNRRGEGTRLRRDIVDAAAEILGETGDEGAVTLRAVARRVGISAPSIYAHFPDRHAILMALAQEAFAELDARLVAAAEAAGADPVARLRAIAEAYLARAQDEPERYRIMFGGMWSGRAAAHAGAVTEADVADLGQEALRLLAETVQACAVAGRSSSEEPATDAVALWLGLHGLAHQRAVAPSFPWPDGIAEVLVDRLARLRHAE